MSGLAGFIATYGLLVVLVGAIVEGETVVVMAGFLCHQGVMEPGSVFLAAFLGAWIGDQGLFVLGRRFADAPFVQGQIKRPLFAKVLARIEENPTEFILAFRFFYGFRVVSPIAVGISSIATLRYVVLNTLSAMIWAALMTAIGYALSAIFHVTAGSLPGIEHKIVAALAAAIIVFIAIALLTRRLRRST
jgi:membrane protein DedA with SNARE-associated domain